MIIAQCIHDGKAFPVKVIETYPTPQGTKAVVETLDGQTPFFTQGSRVSKFTSWTTTTPDKLQNVHCTHENTVLDVTGGFHYGPDGVWDDIHETVYCLECGQEIESDESLIAEQGETDEIPF